MMHMMVLKVMMMYDCDHGDNNDDGDDVVDGDNA